LGGENIFAHSNFALSTPSECDYCPLIHPNVVAPVIGTSNSLIKIKGKFVGNHFHIIFSLFDGI